MSGNIHILKRLGTTAKNSLAVLGFCTAVYSAKQAHETFSMTWSHSHQGERKKKILVLPFHRMKIVEQKKSSLSSFMDKLSSGKEDGLMEVEVRELVDVIHAAAEDPDIVALHGTFGQGFGFRCGGYAHIEEVRNAIRVFNESHRRHYEPKVSWLKDEEEQCDHDDTGLVCNQEGDVKTEPVQKISYAFADTFDNPSDPGNKEYFLASAFSQIHMQPRGNMQLFGVSMSNLFFADALKKYGVKVHVFKHGQYKNAPNVLTERGYTKAHYENTKAILDSINENIYSMISQSRKLPTAFDMNVWKHIHNYGTMTAENCKEIKLVDHLPTVDPLFDLVQMNASKKVIDETKLEYLRRKHASLMDKRPFEANEILSFTSYSAQLQEKRKRQRRKMNVYKKMSDTVERNTTLSALLKQLNCQAPYFYFDKKEVDEVLSKGTENKIAIVHVDGPINEKLAKRVTRALRQVKDDEHIKCIILRINSPGGGVTPSETILEQCKDVGRPVVCSFSNVAASGGYYISTAAEKIFSQRTTLTGSIGVFGVKIDAAEAAKRHGIEFNSVSSSHHAQTFSLFHPLNDAMRSNLKRNMNRVYEYFKLLVSDARHIPLVQVEDVAQGRVWTGTQAKEVGLIDDFGGIHHAISYASAKYAEGAAEIEIFPKPQTWQEQLQRMIQVPSMSRSEIFQSHSFPYSVLLCMDESIVAEISIAELRDMFSCDKDSQL